jgi:hypothetical protein
MWQGPFVRRKKVWRPDRVEERQLSRAASQYSRQVTEAPEEGRRGT